MGAFIRSAPISAAMILVACASQSPKPSPSVSCFKPLTTVARKVDEGFERMLKGTATSEAWKPWKMIEEHQASDRADLRAEFSADGVTHFACYGMKFNLFFFNEGGGIVGKIWSMVMFDGDEATLGSIEFDESSTGVSGLAELDVYAELQPELAQAAMAYLEALRSRNHPALPSCDLEKIGRRLPADAREQFLAVDRAKAGMEFRASVEDAFARISKLTFTSIRLSLDLCFSLALDREGTTKGIAGFCFEVEKASGKAAVSPYHYVSFIKRDK